MDKDSELVHHLKVTAANVHDVTELPELLSGEEETVYGDSGYLGADKRENAIIRNKLNKGIKYMINGMRGKQNIKNPRYEQKWNTSLALSKAYLGTGKHDIVVCESRQRTAYDVCVGKPISG